MGTWAARCTDVKLLSGRRKESGNPQRLHGMAADDQVAMLLLLCARAWCLVASGSTGSAGAAKGSTHLTLPRQGAPPGGMHLHVRSRP